ncbi:MAG: helix-turn-helix transcriptional regulator [Chloroflexi bacterium]|nr:helix-turn-helix transcriptional regulator [Chloroflexota bacterium]
MAAVELPERTRGTCCVPKRRVRAEKIADLAEVLKALADPTRLEMVTILRAAKDPVCICDFTATFDLQQPTVSHHMAKLRAAGIVESTKRGIWSFYSLRTDLPASVRRVIDALS